MRMSDQLFALNDAEIMRRADIVGEIATPGGINSAGQAEAVVLYFIQSRPGHDPTNLRFFAKRQQIRNDAIVRTTPVPASDTHAALHLIENQQHVVFVAEAAQ